MLRRAILANQDLPIAWRLGCNALEQFRQFSGAVESRNADRESLRHFLIFVARDRFSGRSQLHVALRAALVSREFVDLFP